MKKKYLLTIFFIVYTVIFKDILIAQSQNPLIHSVQFVKPEPDKAAELLKGAVEDVSLRTPFSSTWRAKSGKVVTRYSSVVINYPDANGKLQPIDLNLKSDPKGWVADKQPNPCYFHSDRSTSISLGGGKEVVFNKNCSINGMLLDQHIESLENNDVKLDLSDGIHKELIFLTNGIKTNYVFDEPLDGRISVAEEVEFPSGCIFQKDEQSGSVEAGGWAGDYILLAPDGKQVLARFQAAECYDAKKHWCFANYSLQKKDGKNILVTSVPSGWLSKAVYPVTLDPLEVGPTSLWTGGSTPSCLYPNFYTDSIQVTIPGGITISFFTVDYAYVSSTSLTYTIPLNDGYFYLSTSCAKTVDTGCYPGDTAGICYLVPYENLPFLTCCYAPSCTSRSFWLYAHLSRFNGGTGCDTSTIWYSKGRYVGFQYYFSAYVEGYTDSVSSISYTPASLCSNSCTFTMNTDIQYGVPPYTVTHPWASHDTVVGRYSTTSCTSQVTAQLNLTLPGSLCPSTCGNSDTVVVPPPTVVDACGDTVKNLQPQKIVMNPTPVIAVTPEDTAVCSGTAVTLSLNSCLSGTTYNWTGSDKASGTGTTNVSDITADTAESPLVVTYKITGSVNGCNSDTITAAGIINPFPIVTVSGTDTLELGHSETLIATGGGRYSWTPKTGLNCSTCPNPVATPTVTTIYTVTVTDSGGCTDIGLFEIYVKDENILVPNVVTPNGDGIDDLFSITNLQYYPNSQLSIFDRWGKQIYSSSNYQNNWNGSGQSDGVYYYVLNLSTGKKYEGFFQLIK